jgi:S1-C subfamily serine protease
MKSLLVAIATIVLTLSVAAETSSSKADENRPWFGMSVRPTLDQARGRVLHVERTVAEGPSHRAGIRPGDIITRINGDSLQHVDDLDFLLFVGGQKPGDRLRFEVVRAGKSQIITVTVGVLPASAVAGWQRALQAARRARVEAQQRQ